MIRSSGFDESRILGLLLKKVKPAFDGTIG